MKRRATSAGPLCATLLAAAIILAPGTASSAPLECPDEGSWFPRTGDVSGYTVAPADDVCSRVLNENVTLQWPAHSEQLSGEQLAAQIAEAAGWVERSWARYLELFETSPSLISAASGPGSIVVAFFPAVTRGRTSFGGIHSFDAGRRRSVVYMSLDPTAVSAGTSTPWPQLRGHTIAHEMFHAFHYQLRQASFETPFRWLTESLADWGAKKVTAESPPYTATGEYAYHRAMRRFFDRIGDGLTALQYSPHLFWHDLEATGSEARVRAVLQAHLRTGSNARALAAAELESGWHDFARHLLHAPPWRRLADSPDLPDGWTLPVAHTLRLGTRGECADPYDLTLQPVSAYRLRVELDTRLVGITLGASLGRGAEAGDFEWSAALRPSGQPVDLAAGGERQTLCFSDSSGGCGGAATLPATDAIDLVLSNRDVERRISSRIQLCVAPHEVGGGDGLPD